MPTVYLETTIPSYLAAKPSRDLITAAHQQITHEWWETAKDRFTLYVSEAVYDEILLGDPEMAAKRREFITELPTLEINDEVRLLVHEYDGRLGLVGRGRADLPHIAFAVAYKMDYLVTWNCRHIANGETMRRLRDANVELNRFTPLLVTPEEISLPSEGGQI
jgi:hypothetical protein